MSLEKFLQGDLSGYFADNEDNGKSLWLFVHIPKTAGTSFRSEIASRMAPNHNICRNSANRGEQPRFDRIEDALNFFVSDREAVQKCRFASGHLRGNHLQATTSLHPDTRLITMLRRPETRVISEYRYNRTKKHSHHEAFVNTFSDLESYIRDPISQNKMYKALKRSPSSTVDDVIQDLETNYAFVGTLESYRLSRQALFSLLRVSPPRLENKNQTESTGENATPDLDSMVELIREVNGADRKIHRHFQQSIQRQREALLEIVGERREKLTSERANA